MNTRRLTPPLAEAGPPTTRTAWWRVPTMWFVIGGPLAVIVASFTTLALAILNPDPVYSAPPARTAGEMPAVQGRNHAATPAPAEADRPAAPRP